MSNDDRPRITRELVYRNVSRSPNRAMDQLVEDDKSKRIAEAIEKLRKEIKAGDLERDKLKASFKLERQDLSLQLETLIKQKTDAKERAVYHMNQYNDAASKLQLIKDEHASIANKLRQTIQELRDENGQLTNQLTQTQRQYEETRDRLTQLEHQMEYEMKRLQTEVECLQKINEHHEQSNKENKERLEELFAEDQSMDDNDWDDKFMAELEKDQCTQQAKVIEQLQKKNIDISNALDQYKQRYPDLAKIDEEQRRVERELKEAQRIQQENLGLKIENEQLKTQAAAWTKYIESENIDKYSSPQEIVYKLSTGRAAMREAELRAEKLERELEEKNAREEEQSKMLEELKAKLAESEQARKRDMLEKESLSKDKKMLEIHRDLLEHQLTVISKVEEANASTSDSNDFPLTQRLAELEALLKEHQQELSSTRAQLAEAKSSVFTGRLLELKSNPASIEQHVRQEQLENLRLENRQLLKELFDKDNNQQQQPLDDDNEEQRIIIPKSTIENLQSETETLKAKIASKEKRILRLQQVFATKLEEMDHVIQSLLGYSMDFRSDGTVRVCSTSVHESELVFLFKSGANDEVNFRIVGSMKDEYMQRLQGTYDTFVHEQHNIPAFLSSVTLELMNSVGETDQGYGYESQEEDDEDVYYYQEDNMELPGNTEEDAIMIDD